MRTQSDRTIQRLAMGGWLGIFVRRAGLEDMDYLLKELKEFAEFFDSKYPLFGSDEAHKIQVLTFLIKEHLFLIAEQDSKSVGFIAGHLHGHLFNPDIKTLSEVFWWVNKEHRSSRAGAILLQEFIKYGKENCQWIVMTLETISPIKPESLLKRGFKHKESSFIMEI